MQAHSLGCGKSYPMQRNCSSGWQRPRLGYVPRSALRVQAFQVQAEAPVRVADALPAAVLQPSQVELLKGLKGPLVKITAHYHVNFGDSLKVIGSSEEFGAWNATEAPCMSWGDGDIWSLVVPLGPGEHEFKVVVQLGNGELLWESGTNRTVTVPEEAPFGTMMVADCAFNFAELMQEPALQPVSEDVVQYLEAKATAEMEAALEAASKEREKEQISEAAAAVAKALATMDAEAEGTIRRSFIDTEEEEEQVKSVTTAETVDFDEHELAADDEAAVVQDVQEQSAEAEMELQMQSLASEGPDAGTNTSTPPLSPKASVYAKLAQDKPVAIGFMDTPAEALAGPAADRGSAAKAENPSGVVAAFMKSVGKKATAKPADIQPVDGKEDAQEQTPVSEMSTAAAAAAPVAAEPAAAAGQGEDVEEEQPSVLDVTEAAAPDGAEPAAAATEGVEEEDEEQTSVAELTNAAAPDAGAEAEEQVPVMQHSATAEVEAAEGDQEPQGTTIAAAATYSSSSVESNNSSKLGDALSSRGRSMAAPAASSRGSRPPSPGRGNSHVASATAAAAMDWVEGVKSNGIVAAAREAEEAAKAKAARLEAAQKAKSAAAAEADRLRHDLSSTVKGPASSSSGMLRFKRGSEFDAGTVGAGSMAAAMPAPPEVLPTGRDKNLYNMTSSAASAAASLRPPTVSAPRAIIATAADAGTVDADTAGESAGDLNGGMQMLSAVIGCAAVGTVLWSEFVLKETGCGLPPGPYGLLGAAEGLSYLAVLGFAGTGVAARVGSGGKRGLQGALAVPEFMAYGALAAGLLVLASQLNQYGYIPPPLPGGQCYSDAVVAPLPSSEDLSAQLAAQLAALQAILSQLKVAAADGVDSLHLQEQLAQLQLEVNQFSAFVAAQASVVDAQLQASLIQLQDNLSTATTAVSSFVDTQLQQWDIPGKLAIVVDVLKKQEQQLVVELPKQFAELQRLAATATAVVQETALQAATASHLPELLASLDKSMGVLHDVLETRIQQLDVVLTQLHDSCASAATQLASAATAAHEAGLVEASAQLAHLQALLSDAMMHVQGQVWAGYQQLALADHLSDMLLKIRSSAAEVAAATTTEVEKLHLQQQLTELEAIAESSVTALSANAIDQLSKMQLEQRLTEIEQQAAAAAMSLKSGLMQQYEEQLPVLQQQLGNLQDNLAGWATDAQRTVQQQNVEELLLQLQQSMDATAKVVREVAASNATSVGHQLQVASDSLNSGIGQLSNSMTEQLATSRQGLGEAVRTPEFVVKPVQQALAPAPPAVREALANSVAAMAPVSDGLAAHTPDIESVRELWAADEFLAPGVDLTDASPAIKAIWANRPQ